MNINLLNFDLELVQKMQSSNDSVELLMLATALKKSKSGSINVVNSFDQLPNANQTETNSLWLVENESTVYQLVNNNPKIWKSILKDFTSEIYILGYLTNDNNFNTVNNELPKTSFQKVNIDFLDTINVQTDGESQILLRSNGTLWSWGRGLDGQLGDGYAVSRSSPVSVVGGFTDWCAVSIGDNQVAALRSNGTLWTWGVGCFGQLGNGYAVNRSSPVSVAGGFCDWCVVSAGKFHNVAVRANGTLWTWGRGVEGQLGDGYAVSRSSPVSVVGGFTDWCTVSAGTYHNAALRTNGTLWTWGGGAGGKLGDGYGINRSSPVSVLGGFTDWCAISASVGASSGGGHNAAIRTNGTLWTWGCGGQGQLGDNCSTNRLSPVSVVGGFTDWCAVSPGSNFTAAIRTNGTLWTWGNPSFHGLGDGTIRSVSSPIQADQANDWVQISSGSWATVGIRKRTF